VQGIGCEQHACAWAGFEVWTQLWASWTLPFAWALTWRAMTDKRFIAPAAGLIALTVAFLLAAEAHFTLGIYTHCGYRLPNAVVSFMSRPGWASINSMPPGIACAVGRCLEPQGRAAPSLRGSPQTS